MGQSVTLITETEYTLKDFDINQGKALLRLLPKGVTAVFFIKHNDVQGYDTTGQNILSGLAQEVELDTYDKFKVVFASGSVTAKIVG